MGVMGRGGSHDFRREKVAVTGSSTSDDLCDAFIFISKTCLTFDFSCIIDIQIKLPVKR